VFELPGGTIQSRTPKDKKFNPPQLIFHNSNTDYMYMYTEHNSKPKDLKEKILFMAQRCRV